MVASKVEQPFCITCGVCFNVLNHPLTFECQHSYCAECVRLKLDSQNSNGFACPLCNIFHANVSKHNLSNYADVALATHLKMLANGVVSKPLCQWCEEVPAVMQCNECMFVYCSECNAAVHKSAAKRGHIAGKIVDMQTLRSVQKKCSVRGHEEYRAEFYCVQCEEMCCAYCLQVGPHKNHENMGISRAASEVRQKMLRDMHTIAQTKTLLESQASELNRVMAQYFNSYDSVENLITERFNHFRQQLMQREVELRRLLAALRESGDASLTSARKLFLKKSNALNEALLRFERMQQDGSDYEVLESRTLLHSHLKTEVPSVVGTGFKLADLGDMVITGLDLNLDLQTMHNVNGHSADVLKQSRSSVGPLHGGGKGAVLSHQLSDGVNGHRHAGEGVHQLPPEIPLRLTFPVDSEVEATVKNDGLFLRCVARGAGGGGGSVQQIGVRSRELMEHIAQLFPEDGGFVTWRVRLESIVESFVGVVEATESTTIPDGFYWRPASRGIVDGQLGVRSQLVSRLPLCRNGDVLCLTYDVENRSLHLEVNGKSYGVLLTELHPRIAACFIFYPNESLTVLA